MIESFSEKVQGLFAMASDLSAKMSHYYVGVEHIFLVYAELDRQALKEALSVEGISLDHVMRRLLKKISEAPALPTDGKILITPRLKKLLDAAQEDGEVELARLLPLVFQEGRNLPCYIITRMGGNVENIALFLKSVPIGASGLVHERLLEARTPTLNALGRDITQLATDGKIDPIIGRDREIRQLAMVLSRKTKNNPVLIGSAGVGKTAVAEGLALQIAAGKVPPNLRDRRIFELPLSVIVAGTQYRGQFEERLTRLVDEVRQNPEVILFIDELHTMVGAGVGGSGSLDAANILKPALARGDLRCIGATTLEEYSRYIEPDAALERRFSPVIVREMSLEDSLAVLEGRCAGYEAHHGVQIPYETLETVVRLADRHVPDRKMPDKALDLLDEACARASLSHYLSEDVDWSADWRNEEDTAPVVLPKHVEMVLIDRAGLPEERLLQDQISVVNDAEEVLAEEVIGQEVAVHKVIGVLRRREEMPKPGLSRPASFIFVGPTGTGKRLLAAKLAQRLFRAEALVSFDLSEFRERIDVEKLLGAPPGYIGYDRESLLSRRLRRDPYVIVLLENFDLGYSEVQLAFLNGIANGQINDNQGQTVHLSNAIVVVAVDLDEDVAGRQAIGFGTAEHDLPSGPEAAKDAVRRFVGSELVDEVDLVAYFPPLDDQALTELVIQGLDRLTAPLGTVVFDPSVVDWLVAETGEAGGGLQSLERLIRSQIATPLHEALTVTPLDPDEALVVNLIDSELSFSKEKA